MPKMRILFFNVYNKWRKEENFLELLVLAIIGEQASFLFQRIRGRCDTRSSHFPPSK